MNYRHHFHAGNFADVFKHVALIRLARAMQRKPAGVFFLDTHSGRGAYDLAKAASGGFRPRAAEHADGIGRMWQAPDLPAPLSEYREMTRKYDRSRQDFEDAAGHHSAAAGRAAAAAPGQSPRLKAPGVSTTLESGRLPRFYPGSPWFLHRLARLQDRLALCETEAEAVQALKNDFLGVRRVSIHQRDGYGALSAMLPPPEKRALVLIDPPFEAADEWTKVESALRNGLRRLPSGLYAVWYPLTERAGTGEFLARLEHLPLPPTLTMEIVIDPNAVGMKGCGLLVLNPPWEFADQAAEWLPRLAAILARVPEFRAECRWVVPE
jgi:23S rRNA (adenine2030-N6)-methyltransferase